MQPQTAQQPLTPSPEDYGAIFNHMANENYSFFGKFFSFPLCRTVVAADRGGTALLLSSRRGTALSSSKSIYPVSLPNSTCSASIGTLSSSASDWQQSHSAVQNTNQQKDQNIYLKGKRYGFSVFFKNHEQLFLSTEILTIHLSSE